MLTSFETNLYQQLTPFFSEHAYALLREKKQFRRKTDSGFQNVILASEMYQDDTTVEVTFGCRHEQVEQIAQQFLTTLPGQRPDANTLLISVGRFRGAPNRNYTLHSEDELPVFCEQLEDFFTKHGFNFLSTSATLANLDHLLNDTPGEPCRYVYNQTHRYYKGLIAARLNHNPYFDQLLDRYRQLLIHETQHPHELLRFERLISYLHYYSAN